MLKAEAALILTKCFSEECDWLLLCIQTNRGKRWEQEACIEVDILEWELSLLKGHFRSFEFKFFEKIMNDIPLCCNLKTFTAQVDADSILLVFALLPHYMVIYIKCCRDLWAQIASATARSTFGALEFHTVAGKRFRYIFVWHMLLERQIPSWSQPMLAYYTFTAHFTWQSYFFFCILTYFISRKRFF